MGNESIDVSLGNIWKTWFQFKKGKNFSPELHDFQYHLENNLAAIFRDFNNGTYHHGGYKKFIVSDNKRREVSVASVRDRLIHRLIYDYLTPIYDKTFIHDAWSCRVGKGLVAAIERNQQFLKSYSKNFIWRGDVRKFFDSVDQETLLKILFLKIKDKITFRLLREVICSFKTVNGERVGMPIGSLTSQIFANIYLNELDRFVKHQLKPKAYLRYGDDFILVETDFEKLKSFRVQTIDFLKNKLKLQINPKSDRIIKVHNGLKLLGIKFWSSGRTLTKRNLGRIKTRLNMSNISSYSGLIKKHGTNKQIKQFSWLICEAMM